MKRKFLYSREEFSWILYDVANSAFSLILITTMMPIFYKEFVASDMSSEQSTATWGYANSIASFFLALASPILGSLADYPKRKKIFFLSFLFLGLLASSSLIFSQSGAWFYVLFIFVLARIGWVGADLFYNSFLIDVTKPKRFDTVSASGYGWGYIGSVIPFLGFIALVKIFPSQKYSISHKAATITFLLITFWWMFFSLPLIFNVKQRYSLDTKKETLKETFVRLNRIFTEIYQNKKLFYFLVAYFFYIDGVDTIITMATAYGKDLNLSTITLIAVILFIQVVAFPFAILFGKLAERLGRQAMIFTGIVVYMAIGIIGFFLPDIQEPKLKEFSFWFLSFLIATSMGGIQALSRSFFAAQIPPKKASEYFGFYNVFGKFSVILGPTLMGFFGNLFGHSRYGILSLLILFLLGIYFLCKANQIEVAIN